MEGKRLGGEKENKRKEWRKWWGESKSRETGRSR